MNTHDFLALTTGGWERDLVVLPGKILVPPSETGIAVLPGTEVLLGIPVFFTATLRLSFEELIPHHQLTIII